MYFQRSFSPSLATILNKNLQAKNSTNAHLIDRSVENCQSRRKSPFNPLFWGSILSFRCPTFVSREKKTKAFFGGLRAKKNIQVGGGWVGDFGCILGKNDLIA